VGIVFVLVEIMVIFGQEIVSKYKNMRAFEITLNKRKICLAGLEGYSVMTCIITSHIPDPASESAKFLSLGDMPLDLMVAGLNTESGMNSHWPKFNLKIGDEILVKIVDVGSVDLCEYQT
jgi:hypothetical protein